RLTRYERDEAGNLHETGYLATGARNVVTASVEYERYFLEDWGAAVFIDSGSAFDDRPDWHTGVGVGLRWRSPVGPLRLDIARGLDDPDSAFTVGLSIGPEFWDGPATPAAAARRHHARGARAPHRRAARTPAAAHARARGAQRDRHRGAAGARCGAAVLAA